MSSTLLGRALSAGLLVLAACGPRGAEPPLPANMDELDARVVQRVREARAKVLADPEDAQLWADLGMVYGAERLRAAAVECFVAAARLDPDQPRWPYRESVTLAQMGSLEPAIAAMERSIALEPGYPPSHARLGSYRMDLGDLDGAERDFRKAIELDSSYPGGWVGLARVQLQHDQNDEAIAILARLCNEDPEDRTFRQLLAAANLQAGKTAEPVEDELVADEDVPVWNDPWELEARRFRQAPGLLLAGQALEGGAPEEALRLIEEARAKGADPAESAVQLATAYLQVGRVDEARRELDGILAREPDNTTALGLLARVHEQRGERAEALAALERMTELQPTYGGAFVAKGRMLQMMGENQRAEEALRRALELGQDDPDVRYMLGLAQVGLRDWPEARQLFEGVVADVPDKADAWVELALAWRKLGELERAEAALARADALGTASPKLLENVRESLASARRKRESEGASGGGEVER